MSFSHKRQRSDTSALDSLTHKKRKTCSPIATISNEIILQILGFLSFQDICNSQLVDRRLADLSIDTLLWKALYRQDFPNRPLRNSRTKGSPHARQKRLGTITDEDHVSPAYVDWKKRYQVRLNWSIGRCHTSEDNLNKEPPAAGRSQTESARILENKCEAAQRQNFQAVLPINSLITTIAPAGPDRFLVCTATTANICETVPAAAVVLQRSFSVPHIKKIVYQEGFVAVLTQLNVLLIFDIDACGHEPVTTLVGSVVDTIDLSTRCLDDKVMFILAFTETGMLSTILRLQEITLSKCRRSLIHSRVATSSIIAPEPFAPHRMDQSTEIVYDHPYLLLPSSNNIWLYTISSTPSALTIGVPKLLHGYTSLVRSCSINKSLRFVVALGVAGLRVWDMNLDTHGVSVPQADIDAILDDNDTQEIIGVSETRVVSLAGLSRVFLHDFAV